MKIQSPRLRLAALAACLLFPSLPAAAANDHDCGIRRAEATVCPSFRTFPSEVLLHGMSGDGEVLVGTLRRDGSSRPVRFVDGRRRGLRGFPNDMMFGNAWVASEDGSIIAGTLALEGPGFGFATWRWHKGSLEILDAGNLLPWIPSGMSGDGRVISLSRDIDGARWTEGVGIETWVESSLSIVADDVSRSGDRIAGTSYLPFEFASHEWVGDMTTELARPPGFGGSFTSSISPDGSWVVGAIESCVPGPCAFVGAVWQDGAFATRAHPVDAVSREGLFLVGGAGAGPVQFWDASGSARELTDVLADLGVPNVSELRDVNDLSYDGHVVIGRTQSLLPFQAVVSPTLGIDIQPRSRRNRVDLFGSGRLVVRVYGSDQADASDIDPSDLRFGPDGAVPIDARRPRDMNGDGHLDRDFRFDAAETGLVRGDRKACLAGVAADLPFRLCSRVRTR